MKSQKQKQKRGLNKMADVNLTGRVRIVSDSSVPRALGQMTDLNQTVGEFDRRLKGSAGATSNATKSFAKMAQGLGGLVQAYAFVAANVFAVSSAFNTLREAARLEQLTQSMQAFTTATGVGARTIVSNLKEITDFALSTQDAMRITAQATASGFSGTQIEEITKVAANASKVLGRDMGDSVDRLVRGVSKLEPELIDEIGLMTRVDEAARKYATTLGKNVTELTSFEKRMGFANAVIEEGRVKFGLLGDQVEANPFDKIAAQFSDLAKKFLVPIAEVAARLGSVILDNMAAAITLGGLVLLNSIDRLTDTVTRKAETRLSQTQKELERTQSLVNAETRKSIASNKEIVDSLTSSSILQRKYESRLGSINKSKLSSEITKTDDFSYITQETDPKLLKDFTSDLKKRLKTTRQLIQEEQVWPEVDEKALESLKNQEKVLQNLLALGNAKTKAKEAELATDTKIKNAYDAQYNTLRKIVDVQQRRVNLAAASVDIAQTGEVGGVLAGFGRLRQLLSGTAEAAGTSPEEIARQKQINETVSKMGTARKTLFAVSEGFNILEQGVGRVIGTIVRFTNVIGFATLGFTFLSEGYDKVLRTIGARSEELDEAADASENLTKQIKDLSKTEAFYSRLINSGFINEALKQRANSLQTLTTETVKTIDKYIVAITRLEQKEAELAARDTFFKGIQQSFLKGAKSNALEEGLNSIVEGVNKTLSRLRPEELKAFQVELNAAVSGKVPVSVDIINKKLILTKSTLEAATFSGKTFGQVFQELGPAIERSLLAGIRRASEASEKFETLTNSIKVFTEEQAKRRLGSTSASAEVEAYTQVLAIQKQISDLRLGDLNTQDVTSDSFKETSLQVGRVAESLREAFNSGIFKSEELKQALDDFTRAQEKFVNANTNIDPLLQLKQLVTEYQSAAKTVQTAQSQEPFIGSFADPTGGAAAYTIGIDTKEAETNLSQIENKLSKFVRGLSTSVEGSAQLKAALEGANTPAERAAAIFRILTPILERLGGAQTGAGQALIQTQQTLYSRTIDALDTVSEQYRTLATDVSNATVQITNQQAALSSLKAQSDSSYSSLATLSQEEANLSGLNLARAQKELTLLKQRKAEAAGNARDELQLTLAINEKTAELNKLQADTNIQIRDSQFYLELISGIEQSRTGDNQALYDLAEKYKDKVAEISKVFEFQNQLISNQISFLKEVATAREDELRARVDIREAMSGGLAAASMTLRDLRAISSLRFTNISEAFNLDISLLDKRLRDIRGQTEDDNRLRANLEQEKNLLLERKNIALQTAGREAQRELIDLAFKEVEQRNKFAASFTSSAEASQEIFASVGRTLQEDIEQSIGFVESIANVFTASVDTAVNSFVDALIEGKNVLESLREGLRSTLIETLGAAAKDQLKQGLSSALLALPIIPKDEQGNPQSPRFLEVFKSEQQKIGDALGTALTSSTLPKIEDISTLSTSITTNATTNTDRIVQAISSISISPPVTTPPTGTVSTGTSTNFAGIEEVTVTAQRKVAQNYANESVKQNIDQTLSGQNIAQQITATINEGTEVQATGLKGIFGAIKEGNMDYRIGNADLGSVFASGLAGLATALITGKGGGKALLGGVLSFAGSIVGGMFGGAPGAAVGGQIGGMIGGRFEDGGVMTSSGPLPLRAYAAGGIARTPQLAMFGEGSMPEAYVPLPDGRSIPVTMQGSGGNINNISINVAVDNKGNASQNTSSPGAGEEQSRRLGVAISNAVKTEIANQQRPGGLLYKGRR
jgi:cell division protein FtsB